VQEGDVAKSSATPHPASAAASDDARAERLVSAANRYETLAQMMPIGVYVSASSGDTVFVNDRWCEMTGFTREEARGWGWTRSVHPEDRERMRSGWKLALEKGGGEFRGESRRVRPDGRIVWTITAAKALREPDGTILGYIGTVIDVSELKAAQERAERALAEQRAAVEREQLLRRELDHRVGNNLAALLGLIRMCDEGSGTRGEMAARLRSMVSAMGRAHRMITRAHGEGVCIRVFLDEMSRSVLASNPGGVMEFDGPSMRVDQARLNALAMVVQELLTNSLKHGALGRAGGRVAFAWAAEDGGRVRMVWNETGVGPVCVTRAGTGLTIVRALAEGDLGGEFSIVGGNDGVVCTLRARVGPNTSRATEPGKVQR
jgi:PAS domain S-box-containing protein